MSKHFGWSNLFRKFTSQSEGGHSSKSSRSRDKHPLRPRSLQVEQLEERQLLAVSVAEYDAIRSLYSDFDLAENMAEVNVIEINTPSLEALNDAITAAGETTQSDLIVVRTGASNSITLVGEALNVDVNAEEFGSISIVGFQTGEETDPSLVLDANRLSRVMNIAEGTALNLGNVTLTNGYLENLAGSIYGGGLYNAGTLTLCDVDMTNNAVQVTSATDARAYAQGGAVYNVGTMTISDSRFTGNTATGVDIEATAQGAAILNYGEITVSESVFSGNRANSANGDKGYGGGIANLSDGVNDGVATITDTLFDGNSATYGAGLYTGWIVTISGSTFSNNTGEGLHNNVGEITISDSFVFNNTGDGIGGQVSNSGTLTVANTEIYNNTGRGIYNSGSGLSVSESRIYGNNNEGIYNTGNALTITDSGLTGNTSGGLYNSGLDGTISNSIFSNNTYGAGIENTGSLTISRTEICDNDNQFINRTSDPYGGGGICNTGTINGNRLIITGNRTYNDYVYNVSHNTDIYGGGIFNTGTLTLSNSQVADNTIEADYNYNTQNSGHADLYGAGIYSSGTLTVSTTDITKNFAFIKTYQEAFGGGFYNIGTATLSNVLVSENSNFGTNTVESGGGIYNAADSTLTLTNVEVSKNFADVSGAGIYNGGTLSGRNVTIAANSAGSTGEAVGGGINGDASLTNSLIIYNFGGNVTGTVTGNNNITDDDTTVFVVRPTFETDGNLSNATLVDLHLREGAAAINAGDNTGINVETEADLDGFKRIYPYVDGVVDIGAYEYGSTERPDVPDPDLPFVDTPTITAAVPGLTSVALAWNAVESATGYTVDYKLTSETNWITAATVSSATLSYIVSGLETTTAYDFRLRAIGDATHNSSLWSTTVAATTTDTVPVPDDFAASEIRSRQITFTWVISPDATRYSLRYRLHSDEDPTEETVWVTTDVNDPSATSYTITGLSETTSYDFQIMAYGPSEATNSEWTDLIEVTTLKYLAAPTDFTATGTGINSISVEWTEAADQPISYYQVDIRAADATEWSSVTVPYGTSSYEFTGLLRATSYEFRLRAYSDDPTYDYSDYTFAQTSTWDYASTVVNTYIDEWDLSNTTYSLREAIFYAGTYQYTSDSPLETAELATTVTFDADALAAEAELTLTTICYLDASLGDIDLNVNLDKTAAAVQTYLADLFSGLTLDINGNGTLDTADAILLERYLSGLRGNDLIDGFNTSAWGRSTIISLTAYLKGLVDDNTLDINDDGKVTYEIDGTLLSRYIFSLRGNDLIEGFDTTKWGRKNDSILVDASNLLDIDAENIATEQYVLDGGGLTRAFNIALGADTVTMIGIGIQNGAAVYDGLTVESGFGGGVYSDAVTFELDYGFIETCSASAANTKSAGDAFARGGAIYASGNAVVRWSSLIGNSAKAVNESTNIGMFAEADGGAVYALGDDSVVSYCHVERNLAASESTYGYAIVKGGGLFLSGHVVNSLINLNTAMATSPYQEKTAEIYAIGFGGGICQYQALTVTNSTVAKNAVWTTKSRDSEKGEPGNYYAFGGGICALTFVSQGQYATTVKQFDIEVDNSIVILNYTTKLSETEDDLCAYHTRDNMTRTGVFAGHGNISSYDDSCWATGSTNNLQITSMYDAISLFVDVYDEYWPVPNYDPMNEGWHEDYHLADGSKAVNSGVTAYAVDENGDALKVDLDNHIRNISLSVDVGAYESSGGQYGSLYVTTELDIVNPDDDLNSLREALQWAEQLNGSQTITFAHWLDGETIAIDWDGFGTFEIDLANLDSLTIDTTSLLDPDQILDITVDAGNLGRAFDIVNSALDVTIVGLNVANGDTNGTYGDGGDGGAIRSVADSLTIVDASFTNNSANWGGAIANIGSGDLTALRTEKGVSVFEGNTAAADGGAIYMGDMSGDLTVSGTALKPETEEDPYELFNIEFTSNTATNGGAIYQALDAPGALTISYADFAGNTANEDGGAVYYGGSGTAVMKYSLFTDNTAANAGAFYFYDGNLTIINSQITKNEATENGGGVYVYAGTLTARNTTFADNTAASGESLWLDNVTADLYNSIVVTVGDDQDTNVIYCSDYMSLSAWNTLSSVGVLDIDYDDELALFVDAAGNDYSLTNDSQAKDTGNDAYAIDENGDALIFDLAAQDRIFGVSVDLGAYEVNGIESDSLIVTIAGDIVDPLDNETSLREAILYANSLDGEQTIYFLNTLDGAIIELDTKLTELLIDDSSLDTLTINGYNLSATRYDYTDGGEATETITVDAQGKYRVFNVGALENMTFLNLTIKNGREAAEDGGGILSNASNLTLIDCVLADNYAINGGGVYFNGGTNGTLTLTNSSATGNTAQTDGGAICVQSGSTVINYSVLAPDLDGLRIFENNRAQNGNGGAIYQNGGILTVTGGSASSRIEFIGNTALNGGGIYQSNGDSGDLDWVLMDSNRSTAADATNIAGGGAYYFNGKNENALLELDYVDMRNNSANRFGGGLLMQNGQVTLRNTLVAGNTADEQGAGVYNNGTLTAYNVTIANNLTSNSVDERVGAGIFNASSATATLYNAIAILNTNNHTIGYDFNGGDNNGTINGNYTLSSFDDWDMADSTFIYNPIFQVFNDMGNGDYQLYKGDTQAIDEGFNDYMKLPFDLNGKTRIVNDKVDLGAYEYQTTPQPITGNRQIVYAVEGDTTSVDSQIWTETLSAAGEILNREWPYELDAYYTAYPGGSVYIPIYHDYSIESAALDVTTLSLRVHYDSSILEFDDSNYGWFFKGDARIIQSNTRIASFAETVATDDGDSSTDRYILITWNNTDQLWTVGDETEHFKAIFQALFTVKADAQTQLGYTAVNFTDADLTAGFNFYSNRAIIRLSQVGFDIDGDGAVNIATDANLILQYFNGATGVALNRYTTANSTRDAGDIVDYITAYESIFDINGDGAFTADIDGALLTRYLGGFRLDALTSGIDMTGGTRQTPEEISVYIERYLTDEQAEAVGDKGIHSVSVASYPAAVAGETFTVTVTHSYDGFSYTQVGTTLSIRVHYNAELLTYAGYNDAYGNKLIGPDGNVVVSVMNDAEDWDSDVSTNAYLQITWNNPNSWGVPYLSAQDLIDLVFTVNPLEEAGWEDALTTTAINVSAADVTAGYRFEFNAVGNEITLYPNCFTEADGETYYAFDVNGDGVVDTSTDCNLLYAWKLGQLDETETNRLLGLGDKTGIRNTYTEINNYITKYATLFNIDGTNEADYELIDVNFLVRYLAGKQGDELVRPLTDINPDSPTRPTRTTGEEVADYIDLFIPPTQPIPGKVATVVETPVAEGAALTQAAVSDTPSALVQDDTPSLTVSFRLDDEIAADLVYRNGLAAAEESDDSDASATVAAETTDEMIGETLLWEDADLVEQLVNDETLSLYLPEDEIYAEEEDALQFSLTIDF